jgi:hypothetical protein
MGVREKDREGEGGGIRRRKDDIRNGREGR